MDGLQYDNLMTQLSTDFVDKHAVVILISLADVLVSAFVYTIY